MTEMEIRLLLEEAMLASDPRHGGLMDRRDLQQLLRRTAEAARQLMDECDRLGGRLRRNFDPEPLTHAANGRRSRHA